MGEIPIVVGRDAGCDVCIDDPAASRRHARFFRSEASFLVEDLGSKNGTLVNNAPCTRRELANGDVIEIGSTMVTFRTEAGAGPQIIEENDQPTSHTRYVSRDHSLSLSQQRLEKIYQLSERLTRLQNRDELLDVAMEICVGELNFEGGAIGIRNREGKGVEWPVVFNLAGVEGGLRISRTLLSRALEHGERAIFTEDGAGMADPTQSIVQQGIRSAMCVPLFNGEDVIGVIYGDRTSTSTSYHQEDIDFFAGIAKQVSIGLINSQLMDEQKAMIRLNHEIDLARSIQNGLFPPSLPSEENFKVWATNEPGNRVSGDYYDVIRAEDGRTWCLLADVTGEGVAAAFLTANLQAAVRLTIHETDEPGVLFDRWNRLICTNTESSKFITASLCLIDPNKKKMWVSSAGHCVPVIARIGQKSEELVLDSGLPLGIMEDVDFVTHEIDLGDEPCVYFVYSDGVTEAMNREQDFFGVPRLLEELSEIEELNPTRVIKQVRRSVTRFADGAPQSDDITMLAAKIG